MPLDQISQFQVLLGGGLLALLLAGFAWWRDRATHRRHNLDRVGLVNWHLASVLLLLLAIILLSTAGRAWFAGDPEGEAAASAQTGV